MITAEKLAEWQRVCDSGKYVGWLATAEQLPLILAVFPALGEAIAEIRRLQEEKIQRRDNVPNTAD
jgi:hypothetical protein